MMFYSQYQKGHKDWYKQSLNISPIDAYSSIKLMGSEKEAKEIENYISFDKDRCQDI